MSQSQSRLKVVQGRSQDYALQTPNGDGTYGAGFVLGDAIVSKVWAGDATVALATPAVVWGSSTVTPADGAPITLWTIQFQAADTAGLAPGLYRCQVFGSHGGRTGCLFDGLLEVLATPGSTPDTDLASFLVVETLLAPLGLKAVERELITLLKAEASDAIRKWCGQRDFTRTTYTEEHTPELNGAIALRQMPVNAVTRIRGYPQTVLTVRADPDVNPQAWVSMTTTGDWASGTLAYTGLILNAIAGGVTTTTPLLFADNPSVAALAAAIAAVPGWSALTTPVFGLYPSTDLAPPGGLTAQGARDGGGCELRAYTEDLTCARIDNRIGMLWVGRWGGVYGGGWRGGPEWMMLDDDLGGQANTRCQVTYDAGFDTVPRPVQLACAELVKARIQRLRRDGGLKSEENGVYKYEVIGAQEIADLPYAIRCALAQWRISRAR